MVDSKIQTNRTNPNEIAQILGPDAAYAQTCIDDGKKFGIDPAALARAVEKEKADANLALTSMPLFIAMVAEQTAQAKEAMDMMGGDPTTVTSPSLPPNLKIPDYVVSARPNLVGQSTVYAIAAKYLGAPYKWGATGIDGCFDCSGLTKKLCKDTLGIDLSHSSQSQALEIAKAAGTVGSMRKTSCNAITADQIPDNALMSMGPKNGIGHVVIVTTNAKGERVVMQSMGHVGVCEMPLSKFVEYLHRQPGDRTLTVADFGPLVENKLARAPIPKQPFDPRGQAVAHLTNAPKESSHAPKGRIDLGNTVSNQPAPVTHMPIHVTNPAQNLTPGPANG